jgi:hypothetical protein
VREEICVQFYMNSVKLNQNSTAKLVCDEHVISVDLCGSTG